MSCSYRLEKAIQRLEGVDKVRVQIQPPRAEVTPRAGKWVEAAQLRSAVKNAGFKPGEIRCTVAGTLVEWQGQPALRLDGPERVVVLQAEPGAPEAYERARQALSGPASKRAEVEGQLLERTAPDKAAPDVLRIRRVEISGG